MKRMIVMLFASMLGCTLFASLSDGLVAYYPLDGNADDASGYVNNGTTEGVRSVSDRNGNENSALAFDGDDWIKVASSDSLNTVTNIYTMSFWMNATDWNNGAMHIVGKDYQYSCAFIKENRAANGQPYYLGGGGSEDDFPLGFSVPLGAWHHWTITSDGNAILVYLDGEVKTRFEGTGNVRVRSNPMYIGRTGDYAGQSARSYFEGMLDELRIYNRALTATEVYRLYNGQSTENENATIRWSNENHWTDENGEMTARNFSKDDSTICISQGGRFFLSARGSGTLTFNARGSQDGFFYVKDGESLGNYVRNSTDFTMRSITLTGNENEWHTILWATYADGYLGTHAWGEIKDFTWNGQAIEFPFEYPNEETEYWLIAFNANGGLIDDWDAVRYIEIEDGMTFADAIGDLPTPERLGYDFKGWFTEKNGGTQIYDTATATADVIYYAHWEANDEGCVVNGTRWFYQDCGELDGIEIIGIAGTIPTSLVIPTELNDKKVVAIGAYSLYRSSWGEVKSTLLDGVVSLTLHEGLKRIGRGAFEGCLFRSVYIPSTLETIESFAFNECSNLVSVTMSEGVCALNECCFGSCKALSEISLPSSVTNLERAIFQDCNSLTNVTFKGARPSLISSIIVDEVWDNVFYQIPDGLCVYVMDANGWKDENGDRLSTWCGRPVVFDPIPDIGDEPTAEDIAEVLEDSADERLATHITGKNAYKAYREWMNRVCGFNFEKRQAVKDSAHAWLSFALDVNTLIAIPPKHGDLKIDTFKPSATSGAFDFEVSIKDIAVGDGATAANLAEIFGIEGSSTLNGDYSSDAVELSFGTPTNGKVKCTARPKDATKPSFFMKVRMTP